MVVKGPAGTFYIWPRYDGREDVTYKLLPGRRLDEFFDPRPVDCCPDEEWTPAPGNPGCFTKSAPGRPSLGCLPTPKATP